MVDMMDEGIIVSRVYLNQFIEQPEPSMVGDWYCVPLDAFIREGMRVIEIHFPDGKMVTPDAIRLSR